jgi:O-acetyl-ADP-ribose deacetylase (regulator of RNase III)
MHMPVCHCISACRSQSKGVAKTICSMCPENWQVYFAPVGSISVTKAKDFCVINLITKAKKNDKPTYYHLEKCLQALRREIVTREIKQLAIPRLGSGLDGMDWSIVFGMIKSALRGLILDLYIYVLD